MTPHQGGSTGDPCDRDFYDEWSNEDNKNAWASTGQPYVTEEFDEWSNEEQYY